MVIIDTTIYYNEEVPIEVRINELKGVVDKFVIVSGTTTLTGNPNPNLLPEHLYEIADIDFIRVDVPSSLKKFPAEYWLREKIKEHLRIFPQDAMMVMADADETVSSHTVTEVDGTYNIEVDQYYYRFDNFMRQQWYPFMCRVRDLGDIYKMRNSGTLPVASAGGWEFSFFGDPAWIKNKLANYSHNELADDPNYGDLDKIAARVHNGTDIVDRHKGTGPLLDLPDYVLNNTDKFRSYFGVPDS